MEDEQPGDSDQSVPIAGTLATGHACEARTPAFGLSVGTGGSRRLGLVSDLYVVD